MIDKDCSKYARYTSSRFVIVIQISSLECVETINVIIIILSVYQNTGRNSIYIYMMKESELY